MQRIMVLAALLAAPLAAQAAYLADTDLDRLFQVDLQTGAVTLIGSTAGNGLDVPADLAFREDTGELFTIDMNTGAVGTLSTTSGSFAPRWQTYLGGWQSMAWDPTSKQFFLGNINNQIYRLDPTTGGIALLGGGPGTLTTALEVGPEGKLYAVGFDNGVIYEVDKTTALHTPVVTTVRYLQSLAIDPEGVWYGISTADDSLYRIDPRTGAGTLVGPNTGTQFVKAFEIADTAVLRGGVACPNGNSELHRMSWIGTPNVNGMLLLGVDPGTAPAIAILMLGLSPLQYQSIPLPLDLSPYGMPGCKLYTGPTAMVSPLTAGVPLPIPIADNPSLVGLPIWTQAAVLDAATIPANAAGVVFSDYLRIVLTR